MDLDDLHLAVVIAREGSLAAASVELGISQPTLSKAVARLERATGVKLFERQARGMRPTELGQAFLDRARAIDLAAADLHAAMRDLRQARNGVLSFGLGHGVPDRWLLPVVHPLVANGVHVDLSGGMTDSLLRAVAQGALAFAVVGLGRAPGGTLTWQPLRDDPMLPLAPQGHAFAQALRDPSWRQLAQARWIVPASGTSAFAEFERNFADHGLEAPQPCVASRSSQLELSLATALDALVLVPRSVADEPAVRAAFAAITPPGGWRSPRRLAIVHRRAGYLSPAAKQAIGLLRDSVEAARR
jgi:DNA-binding transcriptional LysR family regulator